MSNGTDLPENNSSKGYREYLKSLTDLNWDGEETEDTELHYQMYGSSLHVAQQRLRHSQAL
jgi:hypothetical protein